MCKGGPFCRFGGSTGSHGVVISASEVGGIMIHCILFEKIVHERQGSSNRHSQEGLNSTTFEFETYTTIENPFMSCKSSPSCPSTTNSKI